MRARTVAALDHEFVIDEVKLHLEERFAVAASQSSLIRELKHKAARSTSDSPAAFAPGGLYRQSASTCAEWRTCLSILQAAMMAMHHDMSSQINVEIAP